MTQTQPDRLDQLEAVIERVDRKLDVISTDLGELKLEARVYQAQTTEQFKSVGQWFDAIDQRLTAIETRVTAQGTRLWGFVTALVLALVGLLTKLAFFPQA